MKAILILLALAIGVASMEKAKYLQTPVENPEQDLVYTQKSYWFDQILDHFDYKTTTHWKQRYYVIGDYFNPNVGPVLMYICGEYNCDGIPESRQWPVVLAQRWQGLVVVLEHRYYGQSMPFGNNSLKL